MMEFLPTSLRRPFGQHWDRLAFGGALAALLALVLILGGGAGNGSDRPEHGAKVFVIEGRVLGDSDLALSSLRVRAQLLRERVEGQERPPVVDGAVDEAGNFRLKVSGAGSHSIAAIPPSASRDTHAPTWTVVDVRHDLVDVELRLQPEGLRQQITLLDLEKRPLADGRLVVENHLGAFLFEAEADDQGRIELSLAPGTYGLAATAPGHAKQSSRRILVTEESWTTVLPPERGARLLAERGKRPVRGATWVVIAAHGAVAAHGTADEEGAFSTRHLPPGKYVAWWQREGDVGQATFTHSPREDPDRSIVVPAGARPKGFVVPLMAGCEPKIFATSRGLDRRELRRPVPWTQKGDHALLHLSPEAQQVSLSCPEQEARFIVEPGRKPAHPEWYRLTAATGQVFDPDGEPLMGAEVQLHKFSPGTGPSGVLVRAITDRHGRYHFARAPLGSGRLRALHPRLGLVETEVELREPAEANKKLTEAASSKPGSGTLPALHFSAEHFIEGTLQNEAGQPIPHVALAFSSPQSGIATGTTDPTGHFRLGPVGAAPGFVTLLDDDVRGHEPQAVTPSERESLQLTASLRR